MSAPIRFHCRDCGLGFTSRYGRKQHGWICKGQATPTLPVGRQTGGVEIHHPAPDRIERR